MDLSRWKQCSECGEHYHIWDGHWVPERNISLCKFCIAIAREKAG